MADKDTDSDAGEDGLPASFGRASWKGYLKLSLVSCAVALYPAQTATGQISFATLNRGTGARVRRRYVDAVSGEPVETDEQVRGYEVGRDQYVRIEEEELDALRLESTHTIDITRFVPAGSVDPVYLSGAHYLVPDDPVAVEAYSVIRESMRSEGLAGIGAVVLNRRERMLLLTPSGRGIVAATLRYPYEVRSDAGLFDALKAVKPDGEMLSLGDELVRGLRRPFDPARYQDSFEQAAAALVAGKTPKAAPAAAEEEPADNVINLMDALRQSIAAEKKQAAGSRAPAAGDARRPAASAKPAKERKPAARKSAPTKAAAGKRPRSKS
jgi:DNA end-binding protein Ku